MAEDQRADVAARRELWRAEKRRRVADDRGPGVSAAAVLDRALSDALPADAVVTVDVGNDAYSLGRYPESQGQPVLMSGYLGSIGFGYPAALGAWAADPSRPVVAVTGDGGFAQYAFELTTAVKYGIPVKHVLAGRAGHAAAAVAALAARDEATFARLVDHWASAMSRVARSHVSTAVRGAPGRLPGLRGLPRPDRATITAVRRLAPEELDPVARDRLLEAFRD